MNQQRLESSVEIGAPPDLDVLECSRDVEHPAGVDIKAQGSEQTAEVLEVVE